MARAIMIQGAGSNVGKSMIVAGLARALVGRGLTVAPFKPQNMSNNAAVTMDGGEIGRAQALQARAAGIAPQTDMNPVLLKPESETGAQVVVQGRRLTTARARDYAALKPTLLPRVLDSFHRLAAAHDLVLVEGAGSPAEVNLRKGDIANMGFARATDVPVVLVGDIDRGGIIASLVGTRAVIDTEDAEMIAGFAINRFRGDQALFEDGVRFIEDRTGWRNFGIVPWLACAARLPAEDAVVLGQAKPKDGAILIAVPMLSRISNFDDLDPLRAEPDVEVRFIPTGQPIPREAGAVILAGTKSTLADLAMLRNEGWDYDIIAAWRTGAHIVGLCGGFQMLGNRIEDADAADGLAGTADGLGLFDMTTVMTRKKVVRPISGTTIADDDAVTGYEIHTGLSQGPALEKPFSRLEDGVLDGAVAAGGRLIGTYLHGVFASDAFRSRWLEKLRSGRSSTLNYEDGVDTALDELAEGLEEALDVDALLALAR